MQKISYKFTEDNMHVQHNTSVSANYFSGNLFTFEEYFSKLKPVTTPVSSKNANNWVWHLLL